MRHPPETERAVLRGAIEDARRHLARAACIYGAQTPFDLAALIDLRAAKRIVDHIVGRAPRLAGRRRARS